MNLMLKHRKKADGVSCKHSVWEKLRPPLRFGLAWVQCPQWALSVSCCAVHEEQRWASTLQTPRECRNRLFLRSQVFDSSQCRLNKWRSDVSRDNTHSVSWTHLIFLRVHVFPDSGVSSTNISSFGFGKIEKNPGWCPVAANMPRLVWPRNSQQTAFAGFSGPAKLPENPVGTTQKHYDIVFLHI